MKKFSWLHFSDLHFQSTKGLSVEKLRAKMYEKLRTIEEVNYVFITGDVANQANFDGADNQLQELVKHINCTGGKDNLFWVVGNHDIKRFPRKTELIKDIRNANKMIHAFDDAVTEEDKWIDLARLGYHDYLMRNANFGKEPSYKATAGTHNDELHKIIELPGLNLVMLNTCLLACDDSDKGQLFVLDKKFKTQFESFFSENEVKKMIKNKKPTFVIAHHGGEFLHNDESNRLSHANLSHACLLLFVFVVTAFQLFITIVHVVLFCWNNKDTTSGETFRESSDNSSTLTSDTLHEEPIGNKIFSNISSTCFILQRYYFSTQKG